MAVLGVRRGGAERASGHFDIKRDSVDRGREINCSDRWAGTSRVLRDLFQEGTYVINRILDVFDRPGALLSFII